MMVALTGDQEDFSRRNQRAGGNTSQLRRGHFSPSPSISFKKETPIHQTSTPKLPEQPRSTQTSTLRYLLSRLSALTALEFYFLLHPLPSCDPNVPAPLYHRTKSILLSLNIEGKFVFREAHFDIPQPEYDRSMIGGGRKESQQQ